MNIRTISIITAIILLPGVLIAQFGKGKEEAKMQPKNIPSAGEEIKSAMPQKKWVEIKRQPSKCKSAHLLETCQPNKICHTTKCAKGEYCIGPQDVKPAKPSVIKAAQCVKPDAVGEKTCASSDSQKVELVVKGITVPVLDKCPTLKPMCVLGKCVAQGDAVCIDSDGTDYSKLLKWSQTGNKEELLVDPSVAKAGVVLFNNKTYPDKCKGGTFLLEQACDGGMAKEIGINCSETKTCLNADADGLCDGLSWEFSDGTCKTAKVGNDYSVAYCSFKDTDNDGVHDKIDNCIDKANADQKDSDGDKTGDVCDNCANFSNKEQLDTDKDKIGDVCDNCPNAMNSSQVDFDKNGLGDACQAKVLTTGVYNTFAVMFDGTIKYWGVDDFNSIDGIQTEKYVSIPTPLPGITDAISVASEAYHVCSVLKNGTVKCWGDNGSGQLGNGSSGAGIEPANSVFVQNLENVSSVFTGMSHTCTLLNSGTAKCWGSGSLGELGSGMMYKSSTPVDVKGLNNVTSLATGLEYTCALLNNGKIMCWGANYSGQLGTGTTESSSVPVEVKF